MNHKAEMLLAHTQAQNEIRDEILLFSLDPLNYEVELSVHTHWADNFYNAEPQLSIHSWTKLEFITSIYPKQITVVVAIIKLLLNLRKNQETRYIKDGSDHRQAIITHNTMFTKLLFQSEFSPLNFIIITFVQLNYQSSPLNLYIESGKTDMAANPMVSITAF